ncbi:ABC transporter [Alteraurantiacibacter buctensis]|uniref:ABC transporter n=1 Tax=Alteraurantiacibacter buctensis TaxID=1503981 RepID=A0A844Z0B9_9SPHN|nr:ABC transporter [Alteraurantiacibacter buctensis]MXO72788.1 ABC transporter [Alteraurantiacibacter buctensis]
MTSNWLRRTSTTLGLAAWLALAGPAAAQDAAAPVRPPLLLMGTIPIYWGEAGELTDLLHGGATPHWARGVLERGFELVPLDTLSAETLPPAGGRLLLAQPRTLSAPENVALDAWVRGGGRVLLFADPLMTGHSRFAIGDRRRPQDVALLSPVLTHWGLELALADQPAPGLVPGDAGVAQFPVNQAGKLMALPAGACRVLGDGVAARCALGAGEVLVVADAALLDIDGPLAGAEAGLAALVDSAFGVDLGETGKIGDGARGASGNGGNPPFSDSHADHHGHADPP